MRYTEYGGVAPDDYVDWIMPYIHAFFRILKDSGSLVLNIKNGIRNGVQDTYVLEMILRIVQETKFLWRDSYIWTKPNPMIGTFPFKLKDGWEWCLHFALSDNMKFFRDAVKQPKTEAAIKDAASKRAKVNKDVACRPHMLNYHRVAKVDKALPSNVLSIAVGGRNKYDHPAIYPQKLPEFFIKLLTAKGDTVLDPFVGSGTTLRAANKLYRYAMGIDIKSEYTSKLISLEDYDTTMHSARY